MKTSDPSLLVEELTAAGFALTAEGSRLRVSPADMLTDELRQRIREHRTGLMSILAAESAPNDRSATDAAPAACVQHRARKEPLTPHELAPTIAPKRRAITSSDLVRAYQDNLRVSGAIAGRLSDLQNAHEPYDFDDLTRIVAEENTAIATKRNER
ncbi:hypothetical protein A4U49_07365 [Acidithiobacillus ferrivorans]|uniref:TubC N-terminal docking domain-related protein n=1 Tax=Acidithiobacillus ferrivorans TaxID=160808 RepID=UPI0008940ECB|nr:hypothetical protein [Acidithiobacillus ferrivorans]OFA16436.1 hypothetical protein A4U49_07365 [Acidithiobacillus ferrivorans]